MKQLALALLILCATSTLAQKRPVVQVVFAYHGNTCVNYGSTRPQEAERFAQVVRAELADRYQFIDWRTKATLARANPEAMLTVQLRALEVRRGRQSGMSYYIDYFRDVTLRGGTRIAGEARRMRIGETDPLYTWDEWDRPCEDARFGERLRKRIQTDMDKSDAELKAALLRHVPIGKRLPELDTEHTKAVKLDLSWKELHAGRNSILEIDVDGEVKAELKPISPHDLHADEPVVCAKISFFFNVDDLDLAKIEAALDAYRARANAVRIFMASYERDRDTHNAGRVRRNPE